MAYNSVGQPHLLHSNIPGSPPCHLLVSSANGGYFAVLDSYNNVLYIRWGRHAASWVDPAALGAALPLMLLMMHRPRLHQPRRLDCMYSAFTSFVHSIRPTSALQSTAPPATTLAPKSSTPPPTSTTSYNGTLLAGQSLQQVAPCCCLQPWAFELVCMRSSSAVAGDCSSYAEHSRP